MKKILGILGFAAAVLVGGLPEAGAALLAPDGRAYQAIVIAPDAPDSVRLAANELQHFLRQLCHADLPVQETSGTSAPVIFVGDNPALANRIPDPASLPSDGFVIRTLPDALVIAGKDDRGKPPLGWLNPWRSVELVNSELKLAALQDQGTLCGVYAFLEEYGGMRFYWPGEDGIVCDSVPDLKLADIDLERAPRFTYRYPWYCMFANDKDSALWFHRAGFGGHAPVIIIHSFAVMQKYRDSHPEFFALADGKRAFGSECVADGHGHLCLNNPELIRTWAADIGKFFDDNPQMEVYPIAPNDGLTRICECPACQADLRMDAGERGKFSYHVWKFVNAVAREVAKTHPDKYIGCIAYEHYWAPPEELEFEPNVAVMICHARSSLTNPEASGEFHQCVEAWSQKAGRVYFWDWYLTHWAPWNSLPILYSETIEREIREMAANPKVQGEFIESENRPGFYSFAFDRMGTPAMQHLNLYLTGKLLWNPDLHVADLLDEYYRRFYGPAAEPMRQFWQRAEEVRAEAMRTERTPAPDLVFPRAVLLELDRLLKQAEADAPADSVYARRVAAVATEFRAGAARQTRLEATGRRKMDVPPVADFAEVGMQTPVQFLTADAGIADPPTWIYAGFDRKYLYFKILCFEPEMGKLRTAVTQNETAGIWDDDCVELFFCPDAEAPDKGYQLIVNAAGNWLDGRKTTPAAIDSSWDSEAQIQVTREANRWVIDLAIPFTSLGVHDPNFAGDWAVNFYRTRATVTPSQVSVWSPTGEAAHFAPEKFGQLHLVH